MQCILSGSKPLSPCIKLFISRYSSKKKKWLPVSRRRGEKSTCCHYHTYRLFKFGLKEWKKYYDTYRMAFTIWNPWYTRIVCFNISKVEIWGNYAWEPIFFPIDVCDVDRRFVEKTELFYDFTIKLWKSEKPRILFQIKKYEILRVWDCSWSGSHFGSLVLFIFILPSSSNWSSLQTYWHKILVLFSNF